MKTIKQFLDEHVLSIGLNPDHDKHREQHKDDIHDVLKRAYSTVEGGYSGQGHGSHKETEAIHADISNPNHIIKAVKRGGKISAVAIYKKSHGRKMIALGHDGSDQGKKDIKKTMMDDNKMKRSWAEVSGAPEHISRKMGVPVVSSSHAKELTGKSDVRIKDKERYVRKIGGQDHEKVIMGHPKK